MQTITVPAEKNGLAKLADLAAKALGIVGPEPEPEAPVIITVTMVQLINEFFDDTNKNMRVSTNSDNDLMLDDYNIGKRRTLDAQRIDMLAIRIQKHVEKLEAESDKEMLA